MRIDLAPVAAVDEQVTSSQLPLARRNISGLASRPQRMTCARYPASVHLPTSSPSSKNSMLTRFRTATSTTCALSSAASWIRPARRKSKNLRFQMTANSAPTAPSGKPSCAPPASSRRRNSPHPKASRAHGDARDDRDRSTSTSTAAPSVSSPEPQNASCAAGAAPPASTPPSRRARHHPHPPLTMTMTMATTDCAFWFDANPIDERDRR